MVIDIIVVAVRVIVNVFSGNLQAQRPAVYTTVNRKGPLGTVEGITHNVTIIIDESYVSNWQSETVSQNWDILVYGQPGSVLENPSCVGGTLTLDGRVLRIESYARSTNQRLNITNHVELGCSQL